jgi:hypothetical protein
MQQNYTCKSSSASLAIDHIGRWTENGQGLSCIVSMTYADDKQAAKSMFLGDGAGTDTGGRREEASNSIATSDRQFSMGDSDSPYYTDYSCSEVSDDSTHDLPIANNFQGKCKGFFLLRGQGDGIGGGGAIGEGGAASPPLRNLAKGDKVLVSGDPANGRKSTSSAMVEVPTIGDEPVFVKWDNQSYPPCYVERQYIDHVSDIGGTRRSPNRSRRGETG